MKPNIAAAAAIIGRESIQNALRRIENARYEPVATNGDGHERVSEFNASLASEAYFQQPLTDFAIGWRDVELDAELEFFAPKVQVSDRFEYAVADNAEEFLSDFQDDERPMKGDFKDVEYTEFKVQARTFNRGLQITLDMDQMRGRDGWEEYYTQKLIRRIKRNSLRRAIALLSAAGINSGRTWDTAAGKDPDQEVMSELIAAADLTGVNPNRVGYGATSAAKRQLSHRAQNNAGGYASAALKEGDLAAMLGVDSVLFSKSRYTSGATNRTQTVGNLVLMFNAASGMDTEDASNIKRFVSNCAPEEGGGQYQVYSARLSAKRHVIAVGHYENIRITSTIGVRKFTIN
ncbi:MAG: hypothetical protein RLZZ522_1154 [Verrucomicrobiota bacterium]|jgi:hypothetical protein